MNQYFKAPILPHTGCHNWREVLNKLCWAKFNITVPSSGALVNSDPGCYKLFKTLAMNQKEIVFLTILQSWEFSGFLSFVFNAGLHRLWSGCIDIIFVWDQVVTQQERCDSIIDAWTVLLYMYSFNSMSSMNRSTNLLSSPCTSVVQIWCHRYIVSWWFR